MATNIPNFSTMTPLEIGLWVTENPNNTKGIEAASKALGIDLVTDNDVKGANGKRPDPGSAPNLPAPSGNADFAGAKDVMANFEELIILFQQMSKENKKMSREEQNALIERAVQQLYDAAGKKRDAAAETMKMAIVCIVVTVVGVAASIIAAPLAGVGQAGKAPADALRKITERAVVYALKNIGKFLVKGIKATLTNPQVIQGIFSGISQSLNTIGQSRSLSHQATSDEFQARAQQTQAEAKKSEDRVADWREEMKKMNDLLKTLYDAQMKAEEAAARA